MSDETQTAEPEQTPDQPQVIPTKVENLDKVAEALRPFYKKVAGDGGGSAFYLQTDRVEPAVNALEGLKQRTEERVSRFETQIAELTKRLEAAETAPKSKASDDSKSNPNELGALRKQVEKLAEENKALGGKVQAYESAKEREQHRARLRKEFENSGVALDEDGLELAVDLAEKRTKPTRDDSGEITSIAYLDSSERELFGEMGEPATAADWIKLQTEKNGKTHWLKKAPEGSGSHLSRNGNTVRKPVDQWTDEERVEFIKKPGGREAYKKLLDQSAQDELSRRREAKEAPRRKAS